MNEPAKSATPSYDAIEAAVAAQYNLTATEEHNRHTAAFLGARKYAEELQRLDEIELARRIMAGELYWSDMSQPDDREVYFSNLINFVECWGLDDPDPAVDTIAKWLLDRGKLPRADRY